MTRFGTAEQAPLNAWAITQTPDGFLWLGSAEGLYRFDGFEFEPWSALSSMPLAGTRVRALRVDAAGGLWVGFDDGGISQITQSQVRNFGERDGLRGTAVRTIAVGTDGRIWAGSRQGLFSFDGTRWQSHKQFSAIAIASLFVDAAQQLWVGTADRVYRRRANRDEFDPIEQTSADANGIQGLCVDRQGRLVRTDAQLGFSIAGTPRRPAGVQQQGIGIRVHCASDGRLWVGTAFAGLWRASDSSPSATIETGLLTEGALALFEDRDQSLWVGATDGVYRLSRRAMTTLDDIGVIAAIVASRDGDMWAGTLAGVHRYRHTRSGWQQTGQYLVGARTRALHADANGDVWVATDDGVASISAAGVATYPRWGQSLDQVESMASDASGGLWLFDVRRGLLNVAGTRLTTMPIPAELQGVPRTLLHVDRGGRRWLVNGAALVEFDESGRIVRRLSEADGLPPSDLRTVHEDRTGALWLGDANGLTRFAGNRLQTIPPARGTAPARVAVGGGSRVNAITESADGEIWAGTVAGILRLQPSTFDRMVASPGSTLSDAPLLDGLPGSIRAISGHTAARSALGDLWFITDEGIVIIEATPLAMPPATATRITGLQANEPLVPLEPGAASLPADTSRIRVSFSALDLLAPHRLRFRYRLEGFDTEWIDADSYRTADYTSLAPGRYTFHVAAARDGRFDLAQESRWAFTIAPRFYQTAWFAVAVALSLCGAAWGTWRLRLAAVRRRFAITLGERTRVSREIHDTLLQGYVGVALDLEALALTSVDSAVKQRVLAIRRRVGDQIEDAREAIWHLRSPLLEQHELAGAIQRVGEGLTAGTEIRFDLQQTGDAIYGRSRAERELFLVAQEALSNAVRHGAPSLIAIELRVETDAVTLVITDDGCGFNPDDQRAGRIGLASMRERIEALGGTIRIVSAANMGTQIDATVPRQAFEE